MDFEYFYTRLNVENFPACKAFYHEALGLRIEFENELDEYVEFATGAVRISLFNRQKMDDFVPREEYAALAYHPRSARVVLSFKVTNLDEAIAHLKKHDVEILNPPTDYPDLGFIGACFRDPDGNLIELEQVMDVTVG